AESFNALYTHIADYVLSRASTENVAYGVPGHPLVAEESVRRILQAASEADIATRIVGSESFIEQTLAALGITLGDGLMILDALTIDSIAPRADVALLIHQV